MAGTGLIAEYLDVFGTRIRSRRDRADLVDEVADHLYSATERLLAAGVDPEAAQRRALARFGDPRLVAALVSAVPSKGNVVSLFFSRYLGILSALAAASWIVSTVATYYGYTSLSGSWTSDRYLVSAALVGASCLLTTAVLVGLNLRAIGRLDAPAIAIATIGVVAAFTGTMMSWVVAVWMPLLAVAVTWTLVRARRAHAGSRVFTSILVVAVPVLGVGALTMSALAIFGGLELEAGAWGIVAGLGLVLVAGLVDIATRVSRRIRPRRTVPA